MIEDSQFIKAEQRLLEEKACSDNICRRNLREKDRSGDNQQNKGSLICKIGLC
ncbi:MAG: hypothetical protein V5A77_07620 [Candidatus Bipolaricaulota bacterium]|nr:hypothetical protein [Candidatus Bipolaricaulota bacterium]